MDRTAGLERLYGMDRQPRPSESWLEHHARGMGYGLGLPVNSLTDADGPRTCGLDKVSGAGAP